MIDKLAFLVTHIGLLVLLYLVVTQQPKGNLQTKKHSSRVNPHSRKKT